MQFNFSQVTCSLGKFNNSHFRRPPNYFCSNKGTASGNTQMSSRASYRARERSLTGSKKKELKENWLKTDFVWGSVSTQKMCCCFYLQRWHTSDRRARLAGIKGLLKPQTWPNTTKPLFQLSEPSTWGMSNAPGSFTFLFTGKKIHHAAIAEV